MSQEPSDERDTLNRLLLECLERLDAEGSGVVDEVCRRHPEHAEAIRRNLGRLNTMGLVDVGGGPGSAALPERLGEFRLLGLLGGGGMGVVYRAEQPELRRQVALKVIRPEHLYFPGARERFRREVETVARLQHPGIAAIHCVGEEGGVPYFAMEWVRGATVAQVLQHLAGRAAESLTGSDFDAAVRSCTPEFDGTPAATDSLFRGAWEDVCLRVTTDAARALHFAHERGVVHRDVKPSNVMVTPAGRVMLVDFGLAASNEQERNLTRTGTQLGSVYYMSPEQCEGRWRDLGPRSDVYSLAITLYEMLTLQPAYRGSLPGVLEEIHSGLFEAIRSRNSSISWEAETVCLKAASVDPNDRYETANHFANDLENVLGRRRISARRTSLSRRAIRFAERRPGGAAAIALALLVAVGGPLLLYRHELRLDEEKRRTEENVARVLEHVDELIDRMMQSSPESAPLPIKAQEELRQGALRLLEQVLADHQRNRRLRQETARAHNRIAIIRRRLGDQAAAIASAERAVEMMRELRVEFPEAHAYRTLLARFLIDLSGLEFESNDVDVAEATTREALLLASQDLEERPRPRMALALCTRARTFLGGIAVQRAQFEVAKQEFARAVEVAQPAYDDPDTRDGVADALADALAGLGTLHMVRGRPDDARRMFGRAIEVRRDQVAREPANALARDKLTLSLTALAQQDLQENRMDGAAQLVSEAIANGKALLDRAPDVPQLAYRHADTLALRAQLAAATGRFDDARVDLEEALRTYDALDASLPGSAPRRALDRVGYLSNLGVLLRDLGRSDEARTTFGSAIQEIERLIASSPQDADLESLLGRTLDALAATYLDDGEAEPAIAILERALAAQETALAHNPRHPFYRTAIRGHLTNLASAYCDRGQSDEALECAEKIVRLLPDDPQAWHRAAVIYSYEADRAATGAGASDRPPSGPLATADLYADRAVALLREAIRRGFGDASILVRYRSYDVVGARPELDEILRAAGAIDDE